MLKFHYMLKKLQLHKEEYVLMQAISLFSPGESHICLAWLPLAPPLFSQACSHPISFSQGRGQHSFLCFPQGRFPTDGLAFHSLLSQEGETRSEDGCPLSRPCLGILGSGRWLASHLSPLGWTKPILAPVAFPSPPDRPGVVQRLVVDQLQEQFAMTLKAYIEFNRPQPAHR